MCFLYEHGVGHTDDSGKPCGTPFSPAIMSSLLHGLGASILSLVYLRILLALFFLIEKVFD